MSFKDKLLSSYIALEDYLEFDSPLHDVRNGAIKIFEEQGFPTKKEEAWKYTSLNSLLKPDYSVYSNKERHVELQDVRQYFLHEIDTYKLVFVDGVYNSFLSETTHDTLDVCLMSAALNKSKYKPVIEAYFNKVAKSDSLTSLNTAFTKEGAYINIPAHKEVEKPIEIINFSTGNEAAMFLQPRNLIVVGENAHVQIIERHQSLSSNEVLTNSVTEIFAEKRAYVDYYKIQNDEATASLIDNTYISQQRDTVCRVHTFSFGGNLVRNNLNFYQKGENCDSTLKGITILEGKQHVDHNTLVHHISPNCESHQDYKGLYAGSSTGVFNGKIVVERDAQKIDAYQQNDNILIDDKATINAKPQLEIFADDVKCSHGCTIGQFDEDALFYLRSRGIGLKEARALLMYAFANTVLESVKIPELKKRINKLIATKIGVNMGFEQ
ncbi:Iron-regulated ABC transporter permease protein SufD [Aequorivita sublithincola DSM 14238]|uniref:Iron-regulated ABC transporter permease protein SufD n=1 Tax=Aequorivita sublithincola (strain DSM 14238 / LMG 21431 / ACAM 643 / 9-3) TaxID=746697 RepID=I3YVI4_AEQSU|nr:Fe-S cluster assembly protein SufD [Aequorivita sublithincola]AFL81002.1 Iron-regulated ABC transporter permease protein SufD [Aequorivita sublithincola DSM 14238]